MVKNITKETSKVINTIILSAVIILGMNFVFAWNGPISNPPQGNAYAPINTTATSQTKSGSIWASGFFTTGGGYFGGDVGIGTSAPEARLDVRAGSCYYKLQTEGFYTNCSVNTPTLLTISSDTANYNIATALENPTTAKNVILTINSGVTVYSTSAGSPALDTGTLPNGSTLKIINNGYIIGAGGMGGIGNSGTGNSGGNSINLQFNVSIDNTNGYIYGGGGGGGGGGQGQYINLQGCADGQGLYEYGGGGGGGGAGRNGGNGGGGGAGNSCTGAGGQNGASSPGGGGAGCFSWEAPAGSGGVGGNYGQSGQSGNNGSGTDACGSSWVFSGGAGGSASKAINLNGNTITWIGGNNSTQVKGALQ